MPIFRLDAKEVAFPPAHLADSSGLLAVDGGLSPEWLLAAYRQGIFPWFNPDEPVLWWSPNPRFVLFPDRLKISKTMKQLIRRKSFEVTFDLAFEEVIKGCKEIYRPGQGGTWITEELMEAFIELHKMGFVHSVEVWQGDDLVGGLYGGLLGNCFFGESMFAKVSNASKYGFIILVKNLREHGCEIIDCQVYTKHLESLGAEMIDRPQFLEIIDRNQHAPMKKDYWYHNFRSDFEL